MKLRLLLLGLLVLPVVSGCGEDETEASAGPDGPADLQLTAQVRQGPDGDWQRSVSAAAGDTVSFRVQLFNRGGEQARDVRVRVDMPRGLRVVGGSGTWEKLGLDIANGAPLPEGVFERGLRVGEVPTQGATWIEWEGRVARSARGDRLTMQARVDSAADGDDASASVTVLRGG